MIAFVIASRDSGQEVVLGNGENRMMAGHDPGGATAGKLEASCKNSLRFFFWWGAALGDRTSTKELTREEGDTISLRMPRPNAARRGY